MRFTSRKRADLKAAALDDRGVPEARTTFEALSKLGWDLVRKHLLREVPSLGLGQYEGKGNHIVENPRYVEAGQAVFRHIGPGTSTFELYRTTNTLVKKFGKDAVMQGKPNGKRSIFH